MFERSEIIPKLSARARTAEAMDDPTLPADHLRDVLSSLGRIHSLSRTAHSLWRQIRPWCLRRTASAVRVLDVGCGGGDILFRLAAFAKREGLGFHGVGIDNNPVAVEFASQRSLRGSGLHFSTQTAQEVPLAEFDVVLSTLFLHHLESAELSAFLTRLAEESSGLVLLHDLARSRSGYLLTAVGTWLLSSDPIIRNDGLKSVRGALTAQELSDLATHSGMVGAKVRPVWPCRIELLWDATESHE